MPGLKHIFEWKGRKYYFLELVPTDPPEGGWKPFGMKCRYVCGSNYGRPHFSCLTKCWIRRIWYGDIPPVFEIKQKTFLIRMTREKWKKRWICKLAMTLLEWIYS